jgi:hypothetical protein
MAAMSLALAGIPLPKSMQARNVLASDYSPRDATYSARDRDRADETVDHIRSVRTERWKYIRNLLPQRPYLQPNDYKDNKPCLIALRAAEAAGQRNDVQRLLFGVGRGKVNFPPRPVKRSSREEAARGFSSHRQGAHRASQRVGARSLGKARNEMLRGLDFLSLLCEDGGFKTFQQDGKSLGFYQLRIGRWADRSTRL